MDQDELLQTQPTTGEEMFLNRMYELQLTILVFIPIFSIFILLYCARLVVEAKSEPQPRTYEYDGNTMATQDDRNDTGLEMEFGPEDLEEQRRQPQHEEFQGRRRRRGRHDGPTTPIIQQVPDEISVALGGGGEDPEIEASEIEVDIEIDIDSGTENAAPIQTETNEE